MGMKGTPPSDQLESLARHVAHQVPAVLEARKDELFAEWLDALQDFHMSRFKNQTDVEGRGWKNRYGQKGLSPLTLKIRSDPFGRGGKKGSKKAGGRKLMASLRQGGGGNIAKVLDAGVEFGSGLKAGKGYLVVVTFQQTYKMPKKVDGVEHQKISRWMLWKVGIPAPGPGKQLVHPGREVIGISKKQMEKLANFHGLWIDRVLTEAWESWKGAA